MPTGRKLLRTLLIAGALGLVTTVAVTAWCVWGASIYKSARPTVAGWQKRGTGVYFVTRRSAPGKMTVGWDVLPDGFPLPTETEIVPVDPPAWGVIDDAAIAELSWTGTPAIVNRTIVAYGWPWLAFRGGTTMDPAGTRRHDIGRELLAPMDVTWTPPGAAGPASAGVTSGTPISVTPTASGSSARAAGVSSSGATITIGFTSLAGREDRTVPFIPIVPGVLANTGVFGTGWLVVLLAAGAMVRARRRRRGRCLACGYDRRGIGADAACPECGTSVGAVS